MTKAMGQRRVALAMASALGLAGCGKGKQNLAPPPPHVTVATPLQRDVVDWDEYVGLFAALGGGWTEVPAPTRRAP